MANRHRGEIDAILGGQPYTLCLTLGALAELESAFGAQDLVELGARFDAGKLSARDLIAIIGCGLRGAGHEIGDEDVARLDTPDGLTGYVRIAVELLGATFGQANTTPNPPLPQRVSI